MPELGLDRLSHGHPEHELIEGLEPDQVVSVASRRLPRYTMTRRVKIALWAMRIFSVLITAMVVFTFVVGLHRF